ncbi:phosphoribosylanthranilate isomerase [Pseudochelatococcus sp. B33]
MSTDPGSPGAPSRGVIKICGLSTPESVEAAVSAGADMVGFVFFPKSPRHVTYHRAAELAALARRLSPAVAVVALTVDASDAELTAVAQSIAPDWFQLHGSEPPARAALVRGQFDALVMKAVGIGDASDIEEARHYRIVADRLLLDARPAPDALLPGGNGVPFDHRLIAGQGFGLPFLLSGGLTPENVAAAIALTKPGGVDVSSGVESAPGVKDIARIHAFARAAREALDTAGQ